MNLVILKGRLTADVELKTIQTKNGEMSVGQFSIAVDNGKDKNGQQYPADFINCVAWGKTAEIMSEYMSKGSEVLVNGKIKPRQYTDKEGKKRTVTDVHVDRFEFCGPSKPKEKPAENTPDDLFGDELSQFEEVDDSELPF